MFKICLKLNDSYESDATKLVKDAFESKYKEVKLSKRKVFEKADVIKQSAKSMESVGLRFIT